MAIEVSHKQTVHVRPVEKFDFFQDERVRSVFFQLLTALAVGGVAWFLISNTAQNLEKRGLSFGLGFLDVVAPFDPDFKLVSFTVGVDTYSRIFLIGILNTLYVSFLAIIGTTFFGFFLGIMRLSSNWLISRVALAYVEIVRNVPLLLQIIFWYSVIYAVLPRLKQSLDLSVGAELAFLNIRGLYVPWPVAHDMLWFSFVALAIAIVAAYFFRRWAQQRQDATGQKLPIFLPTAAIIILIPGMVFLSTGSPMTWDVPRLEGFNFVGGASLPRSFIALLFALIIYHAAYLAESVRAGVLSVSKGQSEAALGIGLRPNKVLSLVVIPQAMPAIVPPMISLWMNVVKNSSLATAIGFADLVAVYMQTSLNTAGHAVEIVGMTMAFYMTISLTISGLLNIYNKRVQLVER
ncbi:MAG: ABC transporter permease subunit [Cohaesibacteraceae bacterium]|nr:ABC transporter permease subunit [Cohaesibacteraceae bacterium]MBL4875032.1 ABC transporter permease subunit [Cohaesibacteraceae bacterium]